MLADGMLAMQAKFRIGCKRINGSASLWLGRRAQAGRLIQSRIAELAAEMTPQQIAYAERFAREFVPRRAASDQL